MNIVQRRIEGVVLCVESNNVRTNRSKRTFFVAVRFFGTVLKAAGMSMRNSAMSAMRV
jgi:hypothetical protein